jgi:protein CpxP
MTTTFRKNLLSALAALSMGAAAMGAQAQQTTAPNPGQDSAGAARHAHAVRPDASPEQRAEFAARRTAKLHDALKITPAQESAWTAFVASMKPARGGHPDRAALAGLSAPQRMARHIERQKQRTAAMEGRLEAMNSFYAVLTPEQKKTFDDKAARLQGGFGKHRGGWQQRGGESARG